MRVACSRLTACSSAANASIRSSVRSVPSLTLPIRVNAVIACPSAATRGVWLPLATPGVASGYPWRGYPWRVSPAHRCTSPPSLTSTCHQSATAANLSIRRRAHKCRDVQRMFVQEVEPDPRGVVERGGGGLTPSSHKLAPYQRLTLRQA